MTINPGTYPCISLWQPCVWAIFYAGKPIENRRWHTAKRGTILIHAAKERKALGPVMRLLWDTMGIRVQVHELEFGAIIGAVNLTDCQYSERGTRDGWGMPNSFHWHLEDATLLPHAIGYRGSQGFFNVTLTMEDLRP